MAIPHLFVYLPQKSGVMKRLFLLLAVMTASFSTFAEYANPKTIELTDNERQLVKNNNRFALNLFSKVREQQLSTLNSQLSTILSP